MKTWMLPCPRLTLLISTVAVYELFPFSPATPFLSCRGNASIPKRSQNRRTYQMRISLRIQFGIKKTHNSADTSRSSHMKDFRDLVPSKLTFPYFGIRRIGA